MFVLNVNFLPFTYTFWAVASSTKPHQQCDASKKTKLLGPGSYVIKDACVKRKRGLHAANSEALFDENTEDIYVPNNPTN